ncbi:transposase [Pseudomonas sp. RtIB026]|uniref:REP-associated tyrosine transposase n=1 Tax=Pseudomonas sp. RtIB026 TaxID=2749999 RepID=UPI001945AEC7|nr:transposase [Pseudomonas sp. RtIB026]BCJ05027.1 transposase [Pseudomonas sp. RtIB026]
MEHQGNHRLRRGRFSEAGRPYLLTTTTRNRTPLFTDLRFARAVIQQLRLSEQEGTCQSLAWVLMPDHLHWLVELRQGSLSSLMRAFKSRSSCALFRVGVDRQRVWQPGFHDRALRRDDNVKAAARYIIANPIRAGLVQRAGEYSHWDCVWL